MYVLNNINLERITNGTIWDIAWDLGCDIHMPDMENNKYLYDSVKNHDIIGSDEWLEDQERCNEINNQRLDQFSDDMFNWLVDNNYVIEVSDLPHDSSSCSCEPNVHRRLIDANKLFDEVGEIKPKNKQQYEDIGMFMNMITNSATHKGYWILDESDNSVSCSECGCMIYPNDIMHGDAFYCPNCGRQMKLK